MRLGYFEELAYEKLLADIENNLQSYIEGGDWLQNYFSGYQNYYHLSSVDVDSIHPYILSKPGPLSNEEKNQEDIVNVRILHDALKRLTPWQATNKYMWTYLCHADKQCSEYVRHRWMDRPRSNTVKTRFFVTTASSLLNDNALSRLWWYGHLTYDETLPNPYHYTEVLLTNQTIASDIVDTLNRMNPERMQGVLMAVEEFVQLYGTDGLIERVRASNRRLNRLAAVTIIDSLEKSEIKDLYLEFLIRSE